MLHIVGLGLDDGEITEKAENSLQAAEKIFVEFYTNTETVDIERLEERFGEIHRLSRNEVERQDAVMEAAEEKETAFLVSGDPLTATTHFDIKKRAEERGIETRVVHAPSILTSLAETGLNIYKMGRVVTLPEDSRPESVTRHIKKNLSAGLHTPVLLDIDYDAGEAAQKLIEMEPELQDREAVLLERANNENQSISRSDLRSLKPEGETPHTIIIVGEKSHVERENLESL